MPTYNRPDKPGITLTAEGTVCILLQIEAEQSFEDAAAGVFKLLRSSQNRFPGVPRHLCVEIDGHTGIRNGFDEHFFEFQQEFLLATMGVFCTMIDAPLTGCLMNPDPQINELPDRLDVKEPE
jgi:hypothetical protein